MREASTLSLVPIVECLVNFRKTVIAHTTRAVEIRVKTAKPPWAHLATNQNNEAKQKSAEGMKKVTRPVIKSNVDQTPRQIGIVH